MRVSSESLRKFGLKRRFAVKVRRLPPAACRLPPAACRLPPAGG
jgi:hypothetical protein